MNIGIDSYCFHRYFGDVYPGLQTDPGIRWNMFEFLDFAAAMKVESVSLESCFIPSLDRAFLSEIRGKLDELGLERVLAWGHPDGLEGGRNGEQFENMLAHIESAKIVGASVMRIVACSMAFRHLPHGPQLEALSNMLSHAAKVGREYGVCLAIENHADFTSDELLQILLAVDSPDLGINFDSGNALRVFEDPVEAAEKLAPWTKATHMKDIAVGKGSPQSFAFWPSAMAGQGIVDLPGVVRQLRRGGYDGTLMLELDLMAQPWATLREEDIVRESVAYLRTLLA